jgi:hypothetical protein
LWPVWPLPAISIRLLGNVILSRSPSGMSRHLPSRRSLLTVTTDG